MEQIASRDGTMIATYCSGDGSPLVLVQGTGGAKPDAWPPYGALQEQFRVYTFDRRGRGKSGEADAYDVRREFEDVAAVVDAAAGATGGGVHLMGHSFGGLLALEAALLTDRVRKLILYEPSIVPRGVEVFPDGFLAHLRALLADGDAEGALMFHYRSVGMSDEQIAFMRASPAWAERVGTAHTIPRELEALAGYEFEAQRFATLDIPALLLTGDESAEFLTAGVKMAHAALPDSRVAVIAGQEHAAMFTAPELFAGEVGDFLLGL